LDGLCKVTSVVLCWKGTNKQDFIRPLADLDINVYKFEFEIVKTRTFVEV